MKVVGYDGLPVSVLEEQERTERKMSRDYLEHVKQELQRPGEVTFKKPTMFPSWSYAV